MGRAGLDADSAKWSPTVGGRASDGSESFSGEAWRRPDDGGNHWLRDADGTLGELDRDPYVEYDLLLPYSANTATPVEQ